MKQSLVLLLSGLSLIGCSSNTDLEQFQNISPITAEVCCQSSQDFPWIFLAQNETLKFDIDTSSPAAQFSTGKSYITPVAFNKQSGNVEIVLRSLMLDSQVAIPSMHLLDEKFEVVDVISRDDFDVVFSDALARNRYELKKKINTVETPYAIIYSDNSDLGEKIVVPHPAKLRAEEFGEPMPIVSDPVYLASTVGSFTLEVETLTLSGYGQKTIIEPTAESKAPIDAPKKHETKIQTVQPETQTYYKDAIEKAVMSDDLNKALALLEEAKALNIKGAQETFIKAVNKK